ncbi:hypothetical protein ACFLZI_03810 [Nitrospirota bacterium]
MRRSLVFLIITIMAVSFPFYSEARNDADTEEVFSATLLLTDNSNRIQHIWMRPPEDIKRGTTNRLEHGMELGIFSTFSGCMADREGFCDVEAEISVTAPDGSTYASISGVDVWKFTLKPLFGENSLSSGFVKLRLKDSDPIGEYRVVYIISDLNAEAEIELKGTFMLVKDGSIKKAPSVFNNPEEAEEWMMHYYEKPTPDMIAPALIYMSDNEMFHDFDLQETLSIFLGRIFAENPKLIKKVMKASASLPEKHKNVLHYGMWFSDSRKARGYLRKVRNAPVDFSISPPVISIMETTDVDSLGLYWAAFYATGDEIYVQKVIDALNFLVIKGNIEYAIIGGEARRTLASHAREHKEVLRILKKRQHLSAPEICKILKEITSEIEIEATK